jgi:hypothetical protein
MEKLIHIGIHQHAHEVCYVCETSIHTHQQYALHTPILAVLAMIIIIGGGGSHRKGHGEGYGRGVSSRSSGKTCWYAL